MSITDWFHVPASTLALANPVGLPGYPRRGAGDMYMLNPSDNMVNGEHIEIATLSMTSSLINGNYHACIVFKLFHNFVHSIYVRRPLILSLAISFKMMVRLWPVLRKPIWARLSNPG